MVPDMTMTISDPQARPEKATRPALIVPFVHDAHLTGTVEVLRRVGGDGSYPPIDTASHPFTLSDWLTSPLFSTRWAALDGDTVAGHIAVGFLSPQLEAQLPAMGRVPVAPRGFGEITRFFVDPEHQGRGVGYDLFTAAASHAWVSGQQPVIAVMETSVQARRFCVARGMRETGTFLGRDGVTHVFVDETPPSFPPAW
jgi:GNAT superfamily N-acetyltransferase